MQLPVLISINSSQIPPEGEGETMELMSLGTLTIEEGVSVLEYEESELTGMEGTQTVFTLMPDGEIILRREGVYSSEMRFVENQSSMSLYETPYGALPLGIKTRKARASMDKDGGIIEIEYALSMNGSKLSDNAFKIHVKPS